MDSIVVFSPASVANVTCGFDVLGFCLDHVGDKIIVSKSNTPGVHIASVSGFRVPVNPKQNVASVAVEALLRDYPTSTGFEIEIEKGIKPGSGLGSSAASACGAVFAVNLLLGSPFSRRDLIKYALEGESLASGERHADNLAPVILGGFTLVRSIDEIDIIELPSPEDLIVSVVHPKIELKTSYARAILKKEILLRDAVRQWANVGALVSALYTQDYRLLSRSLQDFVIEPTRSMLIPEFDALKHEAISSGALGFGISGSGPAVFALSQGQKTAQSVLQSMSKVLDPLDLDFDCYISSINQQGVRVI